MVFKVLIIITIILVLQVRGGVLPLKVIDLSTSYVPPEYHPNMTTMWMTDKYGRAVEIYLTDRPYQRHQLSTIVKENIFFFLYTSKYNSAYQLFVNDMDTLNSSTFNPTLPTKVVVHGFMNTYQSEMVQIIRKAYLNRRDVNVVAVDWGWLAKGPWYAEAVSHTESVGEHVAQLIDFLVSAGAKISDFHLIGHSLGAHVAAFASNQVTSGRIQRISGLDPALPIFSFLPPNQRLDPSDADVVDCIHTCGGYLGFYDPLCTIDFYPNKGVATQPGCHFDINGACSHGRSYHYFSSSIVNNFTAKSCASVMEIKHGHCKGTTKGVMGDPAPSSQPGLYYLKTSNSYPYVKN